MKFTIKELKILAILSKVSSSEILFISIVHYVSKQCETLVKAIIRKCKIMLIEKQTEILARWFEFIKNPDSKILEEIFADDSKFYSPFLFKTKPKKFAVFALYEASQIFENFQYVRRFDAENACCLQFTAQIGETFIEGVDLITFDSVGQITEFKVMIRPGRALQTLVAEMTKRFTASDFPID